MTGTLLFADGTFHQYIEGPRDCLLRVYDAILRDRLHHNILELVNEPIAQREFGQWSMGYRGERLLSGVADEAELNAILADESIFLSPGRLLLNAFLAKGLGARYQAALAESRGPWRGWSGGRSWIGGLRVRGGCALRCTAPRQQAALRYQPHGLRLAPRRSAADGIRSSVECECPGEIQVRLRDGKQLSEGRAVGPDGQPTTVPKQALAGAQLPFGGVKGASIAVMIELLAGPLLGDLLNFEAGEKVAANTGATKRVRERSWRGLMCRSRPPLSTPANKARPPTNLQLEKRDVQLG